MSNTIKLKKSSVAAKVPLASDLDYGELAINYTDGNLFFKNSNNNIQPLASTQFVSVTGNVTNDCTLSSSGHSICLGTYIWTDDHSNDASSNKGALIMTGNTQQNLVSNINIDSTVSPVSASANIVSNVTPAPNSTINLSNSANSTGFIGGY